jgi:hypothetical protein
MNLYIKIENNAPVDHPVFMDNLIAAFGSIPAGWEPFIRVQQPVPTVYQVLDSAEPTYQYNAAVGYWMDTWALRDMTDAERAAAQQAVKDAWAAQPNVANFAAWTFDETTCEYVPPTARPTDGPYAWRGSDNSWVAVPAYPEDGNNYTFDLATGTWTATPA